jgi:predicted DCC family thiol-disulfide oxidoreductase YuxK
VKDPGRFSGRSDPYPADVAVRRRVTVLYDEDCGFCRWSADKLRAWDSRGALAFASIQCERGTGLLHAVPRELRLDSMHAVTPDGRVWSGGEAVRVVLEMLPGGSIPGAVARTFPSMTEHAYRVVVRNRERLGRWLGQDACSVDPSRADGSPLSPGTR